jgi:hypothetical protein
MNIRHIDVPVRTPPRTISFDRSAPPMRCTRCGAEYDDSSDNTLFTTVDEQLTNPGHLGAKTRTHPMFLCPACAASRRKTERLLVWMFVAFLASLLFLGLISRL